MSFWWKQKLKDMSLENMMMAQVFTTVMSMFYSYKKQTKQQQQNKKQTNKNNQFTVPEF